VLGTLVFDGSAINGEVPSATLRLRRPAVTYPGQPFVARALSPMTLLGGGRIAGRGVTPSDSAEEPEFEAVARVLVAANDAALEPAQLAREANLRVERVQAIAEEMVARGEARRLEKPPAYLSTSAAEALSERIASALQRREAEAPWIAGTTLLALARELQVDEPQLLRFLASEVEAQRIEARAGYYFLPQHQPRLSDEQQVFFASAIPVNAAAPLIPAPLDRVVEEMRRARIAGLTQAFDMLVATGALVKVGTDVYRGEQIATIRRRLAETLERDGTMTPARFRDAVGTTRKYALPLLEWFDATGVTVRDGDVRRLRGSRPQPKTPA
jgi:selenocysteine-specific elongation factor